MIILVKADYTNNKNIKHMYGNFNTSNFVFTSKYDEIFSISKNFERFNYKARIIITNESDNNLIEWIFTLMPTDEILNNFEISENNINCTSSDEENDDDMYGDGCEEDGGPDTDVEDEDYNPEESESSESSSSEEDDL